ncbi:ImmA/IrrE family metallo-endopeptidase [Lacticaseibacillus paracasei]|uniref:ImmA/IrrE family metallo-endopeptidase n=1 Tax=Lacticaseibacillus paracasei TaxID=1597 RepID=UPI002FF98B50
MEKVNYKDADFLAHKIEILVRKQFNNAVEYNAVPVITAAIQELPDDFFPFPLRDGILGTTIVDSAVTVTINSNIHNNSRRYFTYTHELCHVLLDTEYLRSNPGIDVQDDNGLPNASNYSRERRANRFAALSLLPDSVLNAVMMEGKTAIYIHEHQKVSYETLKYRIVDFVQSRFLLPRSLSIKLAEAFTGTEQNARTRASVSGFWNEAEDAAISELSRERIIKKNKDLVLGIVDPLILVDRERKKEIKERNRQSKNVYDMDPGIGIHMLAEYIDDFDISDIDDADFDN